MSKKTAKLCFFILTGIALSVQTVWAVNPAEPQSGGRFFPGKGTRAGIESTDRIDDSSDYLYGRTETGNFDRHHYAKGLQLGIVNVRPTVGYTGEYDSNIFLTEDERESDYINKLLGGVDADVVMEGGKYILTGGVESKSEWFIDHSNQNHTDWTYRLGAEVHLPKIDFTVYDEFRDTSSRSGNDLTARVERFENQLGGLATIPFGQFFTEVEAADFITDFRGENGYEQYNRHEFSVYPRLGINIGAKSQALLEYGYKDINYENQSDRDGMAHQGQVGVRGFLGNADLVSYQAWGGWQFRHYENGDLRNFDGFIGHGELMYKASETTRLSLQAIRRPEESLETGQTFYTRNEVALRVKQQVAEQWFVTGGGGTGFNHYSNDRLDFLWEPRIGIEYVLPGKILALFTEYKFSARHSDAENRDYGRHIANFGIKAEV